MHVLKWWKVETRMWFVGEDVGGGGSEAPAGDGTPAGDGGGGSPSSAPSSPSPDGGSPAPSSTPLPSPAPAPPSFDWSALGSAEDLDHVEIPAAPSQPVPEPVPPVQPTTPPAQPVPPKPQEPQTPATATAQPSGEGAPEGRPLTASDPWRIAEGLEANRDAVITHLAQAKFALSEDDIKDLDTDVTVAVPKLLARVFLESQVSMQKFLAQAVPGMVKQFNAVSSANEGAEKKFFDTHKALNINDPQHRAAAVRIATVYRQANPGIPLDQLIAEVGPMVMATLRVSATPTQAGQRVGGTPTPPMPRGGTPFMPAVNGGGGLSPTSEPGNPWEGLGRNFDE